jgi:phage gp36-like protein
MTTLIAAVELTEKAAMERLFSAAGVQAFSDHESTGETDDDVVNDAIYDASEEILAAVNNRYAVEAVATSRVVHTWATFLACYYLCLRRGNDYPASWATEIERIRAELELIRHGKGLRGVALRADLRPTWSNLQIDRRWPRSKVRVIRQTGPNVTSTQRVKPADEVVIYDG